MKRKRRQEKEIFDVFFSQWAGPGSHGQNESGLRSLYP